MSAVVDEKVLDKEQWKLEAESVINDVKSHVKEICISTKLPSSNSCIYLNLTTPESKRYCIELTAMGFRIVGKDYDVTTEKENKWFETPYSILDSVSAMYRTSFGQSLRSRLEKLQSEQAEEDSDSFSDVE